MYQKTSSLPQQVPQLSSNPGVGNITSAVAEIDPGRIQLTQAPIKSYNMDNTELMGIPLFSDEPRTKSERSTKVYLGRIPIGISDYFIEQLLLECGSINWWKRPCDSSGKSMKFGFVEFQRVEGMLRCLRLMNGLKILNTKIITRVDAQTEFFVKEWADLKRSEWERKRWDGTLLEELRQASWEEALLKDDQKVNYSLNLMIHNYETNKGNDVEDVEEDKEHPREKEREKRLQSRIKERERRFKEKEKEWVKREDQKERERKNEVLKEEEKQRQKTKSLRWDLEYDSDDEQVRRRKYSKKYQKAREDRKQMRIKEMIEDQEDAKREFELLNPGVATLDEKFKQAELLEAQEKPENEEEYNLAQDRIDLDIQVQEKQKVKLLPKSSEFLQIQEELQETKQQFVNRIPAIEEKPMERPKNKQKHKILTEKEFYEKFKTFKKFLEQIPRRSSELFDYPIQWNLLAQNHILDKRLGPFISKLLVEYLNQDDRALVQMIVKMVANREDPKQIHNKLSRFLDEDASHFLKRVWRMIIFEYLKLKDRAIN